ncbi:adhesion G protein-coupled receptor E1-like isoform X2 [Pelodiscus sinensis]|uniref:adhesion G protein-coupled receptor E1-like isoform X2 n=1 Tax=Pelodiscus sinensis TaxID=13735 RepID=UPI003F6D7F70
MRVQFITPLVGLCWLICLKETHFSNAEINECSQVPPTCGPNAVCLDTAGGFSCMCEPGYRSSKGDSWLPGSVAPLDCSDIDECSQVPSVCGLRSFCINTRGGYSCRCHLGYSSPGGNSWKPGDSHSLNCTENPCANSSICPNYATCEVIPGGHRCTCQPGSESSTGERYFTDTSVTCQEINECSQVPPTCGPNALCLDTARGFSCMCEPGYRSSKGDSWLPGSVAPLDCSDIDECSQVPSVCGLRSSCVNTPGSYSCQCQPGHSSPGGNSWKPGDSHSLNCTDIDECSQDQSPCGPNSNCMNRPGSYTCICRAGYLPPSQLGAPFNCTEVTSKCRAHFLEENDLVRKSQNQSLDTAHGSSPEDAAYCTLLKSTFRALGEPCKEKNSTVCLEKAAGGFASILEQTSSWSNLSTEQLSVSATIVLHSVERIVMDILTNPTENGNLTFWTEQLDVRTIVIGDGCSREDSVISLGAKGETMEIRCKTVQGSMAEGAAGVAFVSYVGMETIMNSSFFHNQKAASGRTVRMISRVVSAWLTSQTKTNFTDPVNYTFEHIMPSNPSEKPTCVSWECTAQSCSWSTAGCRVLHSNATHTTCSCDHVTSLAVLMAWGEITADFLLSLISHVGLALSLLCLLLAILTFLLCRSIRNVNTSIHLQLCLCLFVADLLFLRAVNSTSHQVGCAVIAGLLHYLFLACFAWMFLEAVVLLLTVRSLGIVNYFSTHSPKMRLLSLFGYGFPALVVAVSAVIMPKGYGGQENCWLSMERGFIWSFLGPVCAIVAINSVLFAVTLWMLQRKLSSLNSEVSTLKDTRLLTFKAIAQVFILGCTWIFGLFQTGPAAVVMAYLFTILNSLQGVFIFLVHCLLNRQVQEEYKRWFTSKSKSYSEVSMSTLATSSKVG